MADLVCNSNSDAEMRRDLPPNYARINVLADGEDRNGVVVLTGETDGRPWVHYIATRRLKNGKLGIPRVRWAWLDDAAVTITGECATQLQGWSCFDWLHVCLAVNLTNTNAWDWTKTSSYCWTDRNSFGPPIDTRNGIDNRRASRFTHRDGRVAQVEEDKLKKFYIDCEPFGWSGVLEDDAVFKADKLSHRLHYYL